MLPQLFQQYYGVWVEKQTGQFFRTPKYSCPCDCQFSNTVPRTFFTGLTVHLGLHNDSANDDSAIDKMAARFWHTDDSATFLFEKKAKKNFPTPHGFHLKTFPTPYGCQKGLTLPLTGFFYPWRELIFSLKKLFLTPNLLQIGKNGLNWPSFFYVT